jgi:hypothetical protein
MTAKTTSKPTNSKVIIPVVIVVILCCICLVTVAVLAYKGIDPLDLLATDTFTPTSTLARTDTLTPTSTSIRTPTWTGILGSWLVYSGDCSGEYSTPESFHFLSNNTFYFSHSGTWSMVGDSVDFSFDDYPNTHYTGTLSSSMDYMEGTFDDLDDMHGCWYAERMSTEEFILKSGGFWFLDSDWGCEGDSYIEVGIMFLSDHTFQIVEGSDILTGTWTTSGDFIEFIFDESPNTDYVGTLDTDTFYASMEGTMSDSAGNSGCWHADKNSYGGD